MDDDHVSKKVRWCNKDPKAKTKQKIRQERSNEPQIDRNRGVAIIRAVNKRAKPRSMGVRMSSTLAGKRFHLEPWYFAIIWISPDGYSAAGGHSFTKFVWV